MRDYEVKLAQSRRAYGQITWLVRIVQNWRMRKTLKELQHFNDYQLRDIGLVRDELRRLIALPLDCDHTIEAERSKLASARLYENTKSILALPDLGRANSQISEQPARNAGGIVAVGLTKELNQITLLSSQNC